MSQLDFFASTPCACFVKGLYKKKRRGVGGGVGMGEKGHIRGVQLPGGFVWADRGGLDSDAHRGWVLRGDRRGLAMDRDVVNECCLCGSEYEGHGNNPSPVSEGEGDRCCNICNTMMVIPARLSALLNLHS